MSTYKVSRQGKEKFVIFRRGFLGFGWKRVDEKPSWSLARHWVMAHDERELIYEEVVQVQQ